MWPRRRDTSSPTDEIAALHAEHWRPGFGSVTVDELDFFRGVIAQHRPESFIEIGTASGLSGALICRLMEENGGRRFVTLDHDNSFFGDPTKENGFLFPAIYPDGRQVEVVRKPFTLAYDIPSFGETFDMGFIDANHQHPWPLLDTLSLYPYLRGPKIVLEHDLDLYRKQDVPFGIGPKHLFDQVRDANKVRAEANNGNLFMLDLDISRAEMERIAKDAFLLPWSLRSTLNGERLEKIRTMLRDHYDASVLETFEVGLARYNKPLAPN